MSKNIPDEIDQLIEGYKLQDAKLEQENLEKESRLEELEKAEKSKRFKKVLKEMKAKTKHLTEETKEILDEVKKLEDKLLEEEAKKGKKIYNKRKADMLKENTDMLRKEVKKRNEWIRKLSDEIVIMEENAKKDNVAQNEMQNEPQKNKTSEAQKDKPKFMEQNLKSINDVVKIGDDMYRDVKKLVADGSTMNLATGKTAMGFREVFMKWTDAAKLEYFREKLGFKEFMTEFPVLSRYAICMGQYSNSAFRKMLDKVSRTKHPPPTQRPKGYMEDQWVRRQADYIKYLAESYMKHPDKTHSNAIWQTTYKILKKEFDEFRDKYADVETHVKESKEQLKASYAKDFIDRLMTGAQTLKHKEHEEEIIFMLKNKLYKRNFKLVMKQLRETCKQTAPTARGYGHGPENQEKKPTITMVEHVDPARINEVPRHMLLNEDDAKRLPGYQSSLDVIDEE